MQMDKKCMQHVPIWMIQPIPFGTAFMREQDVKKPQGTLSSISVAGNQTVALISMSPSLIQSLSKIMWLATRQKDTKVTKLNLDFNVITETTNNLIFGTATGKI